MTSGVNPSSGVTVSRASQCLPDFNIRRTRQPVKQCSISSALFGDNVTGNLLQAGLLRHLASQRIDNVVIEGDILYIS